MPKRKAKRLTKTAVEQVPLNGMLWDSEVPGFGVRVTAAGARSFVFQYRSRSGHQGRLVIGRFPSMTVEEARRIAREHRVAVDKGGDPSADRRKGRAGITVNDYADRYLGPYAAEKSLAPATVSEARRVIDRYVRPSFGSRKIADLTARDVRVMMVKAKEGSGPAQANRVKAVLSRLTTLAIEDGNCFHNPCRSIKPYALEPRQGYLTPAQASALMRACASYPHQEPANVVRLLLFTGARLGEVLSATWSQFDLENGVWTKPSAHTKARRVHRLALTTEAVELLRAMEESRASSLYLFPGRKPGTHLTTIRRPWKGILAAAGLGHWYRHDLRRTTATLMLSAGADVTSVGKTLGHTQAQTTLRYAQLMPDHQRQMLSRGLELVSAHAA